METFTFRVASIVTIFERNGTNSKLIISDGTTNHAFTLKEGIHIKRDGTNLIVKVQPISKWPEEIQVCCNLSNMNSKFCLSRNFGGIGIADIRNAQIILHHLFNIEDQKELEIGIKVTDDIYMVIGTKIIPITTQITDGNCML